MKCKILYFFLNNKIKSKFSNANVKNYEKKYAIRKNLVQKHVFWPNAVIFSTFFLVKLIFVCKFAF